MIKTKLKICSVCHQNCVLWQSVPKMCKDCATRLKSTSIAKSMTLTQTQNGKEAKPFKIYRTKEIKKVSTRQQVLNKAYSAQRNIYLKNHPECKVNSVTCTGIATDIHHKKGRGEYLLDERTWLPVCRPCHKHIEEHPLWAKDNSFSESRLTNVP